MSPLVTIAFFLLCLAACAGYGLGWLRLLGLASRPDPLRWIHALALGMGTAAYLILALGLLGFLTGPALAGVIAPGLACAVAFGLAARRNRGRPEGPADPAAEGGAALPLARWPALLLASFTGLLALTTLLSVFRPADGLDWDSLSYHLAAPKIYLREARIPFIAYDSHTHFPFTMEMLYTLGLSFDPTGAGAKLFHWAAGWLTALAVGAWSARLRPGGRPAPEWLGPMATGLFAGMPLVLWEMGTAYVELGAALFQFLALAALLDGTSRDPESGALRVDLRRACLAGVLSGFALGTKMTALLPFGLLGLGLLWVLARSPRKDRGAALRALAGFGALGILVGSPWYLKSWLWVHNPVYPFFYSLFPGSFSWTPEAAAAYSTEQGSFGMGRDPGSLVKSLWNLSMHGRAFYINDRSLIGDKLGSVGPIWAGLLPLALWTRGWDGKSRACLLYGLGSLGLWFVLSQQVRYLIPVFAPLAVAAAVIVALLPALLRAAAGGFAALALYFGLAMHAPIALGSLAVVSGQVGRGDYLRASLPGLYEAAGFVNGLPAGSRVAMYQETRGFYFDRSYFWANPLQHNLIRYDDLQDGDELVRELRRFGITHVLINFDFCRGVEGSAWYRHLMNAIQRGRLEEAFRSEDAAFQRRGILIYRLL